MDQEVRDIGFGQKYDKRTKRIINKDGSFNVQRDGTDSGLRAIYEQLVGMPAFYFFLLLTASYFTANFFFAGLYYWLGVEHLVGVQPGDAWDNFLSCYYFSFQTMTTVGYGAISPSGLATNALASVQAFVGWLGFAMATGLVYGRFSKPQARLLYSSNMLLSPFQEGKALMFRISNKRNNILMDLHAEVFVVLRNETGGKFDRRYFELPLEISRVNFLPLSWTIVHPISEESPLYGKNKDALVEQGAEVLILIKGYDDTFNQVIHSRYSYTAEELVENAKFKMAYETEQDGGVRMHINAVHAFEHLEAAKN